MNENSVSSALCCGGAVEDFIRPVDVMPRCNVFDRAFGRKDAKVSELVSSIEAKELEVQSLQDEIEALARQKEIKKQEINQLRAEIQILKEKANRADDLTANQLLELFRYCFNPRYTIEAFCRLFLCVLPLADIPRSLYQKYREMYKKLVELIQMGADGVRRLYGYQEQDGKFPIDSFRVACTRLRWGKEAYVFTLRDQYTLAEIERAYLELPEVKKAMEAEKQRLNKTRKTKTRTEDNEKVEKEVLSVLAEMPYARATDIDAELERRTGKSRSTVIRWRTKIMKKHHLGQFALC